MRGTTLQRLQNRPRGLGGLGCTITCGCRSRSLGTITDSAGTVTSVLSYADAIKQAFKGDAVGGAYTAAITYAGGIAAIGNAIASFANRSGDAKSAATTDLVATLVSMGLLKQASARPPVYLIPDLCRIVRPDAKARAVSEAMRLNLPPSEVASAFKAWIDSSTPWNGPGCMPMPSAPTPAPAPTPTPPTPAPVSVSTPVSVPAVMPAPLPAPVVSPTSVKVTGMSSLDQQKQMAQTFQSQASGATNPSMLLSAYSSIMGKVPGRLLGLSALKQVMNAVGATGGWPNVKKWVGQAVDDVFNGCKNCTPPTIPDWVRQQIAAGQTNPAAMVSAWNGHVNSAWGSKWLVGTAGAIQNQLLTDIFDYELSQIAPQAPQTYALPDASAPPVVPTGGGAYQPTTPTPVIPQPVATLPTQTPVVPVPVPMPAPAVPPSSATDPALQAYIKALLDQGVSQQQAFSAALQALGNAGQQITPQTQQQVAQAVQSASASPIPASMLYVGGGIAAIVLIGVMMNRRKRHA